MNKQPLTVIEQKTVLFYGDNLVAVLTEEEGEREVYVPIRPITELLGVTFAPQTRRINRDPVLSEVVKPVPIATEGGVQKMVSLPVDYISGFLFGINANRVSPEIRERLIRYQKDCYRVLNEAFREGRLTPSGGSFDELLKTESPSVQAYKLILALEKLARQQIMIESRIDDHELRLEQIEGVLGDSRRTITPAQATRISQAVKAVALELGKRSGRNEFGGVYGEFYRRFEITSYRELRSSDYETAIRFLTDWYLSITGESEIPF